MPLIDYLAPEETVGEIWNDLAGRLAGSADGAEPDHAATLEEMRRSVALLFRALGGPGSVDIGPAARRRSVERAGWRLRLAQGEAREAVASFDGERLRLPPRIAAFPDRALNRKAYLWLAALGALTPAEEIASAAQAPDPGAALATLSAAARAQVARRCPGLRTAAARFEAEPALILELSAPGTGEGAAEADAPGKAPVGALTDRKLGERRDLDQANRRDSFIVNRFETILSWLESMNINRSVEDEDEEDAAKAAEDQDLVTLTRHDRKAATRLKLHLDLSPLEAEHVRLSGEHLYPEWNARTQGYMPDHVRVLEAPVQRDPEAPVFTPDARRVREIRRQFETLRPRRILMPRQIDGQELDLDAVISARAELRATGRSSDRVYLASRQVERDLSVAILMDCSRSTEAAMGETCVMDVARDALAALAQGIDAAGDRLGIWGFSSLRRDRVFLSRCKGFDQRMGADVTAAIGALRPGRYTRLGAAIRHAAAQLAAEGATSRLLLVLTDGKPNDIDHYEGRHGIEDSRMAVREARRMGLRVHGVIVDEDGQDWFARIFGKGGFSLLPHPERLTRALPEIYRTLTEET